LSTIDRAALIEQAARESWKFVNPRTPWADTTLRQEYMNATAVEVPVIAKALLAPLRELHVEATNSFWHIPGCAGCGSIPYPCPTVRLLDAMEAAVGVSA